MKVIKTAWRFSFLTGAAFVCTLFACLLAYQWYILWSYTQSLEVLKKEYQEYIVALKRSLVERDHERNQSLCAQLDQEALGADMCTQKKKSL